MKPVSVSVDVPDPREDVYEFLAPIAAHESFTDHMMVDWQCSGPPRGVGSKAHVTVVVGGRRETVDIETIEDVPPSRITERNIGAGGRRVATGTYTLEPTPTGGTHITFTYAWEQAPFAERAAAPLVRRLMRRELGVAMTRLADQLEHRRTRSDAPDQR
ncbi:MAG TPA: SRPBCC family protein [Micromonosporaceae bacterium]